MKRFSKNDNQAICNYCGKWQSTDLTNQQLEEMDWKCDECKAKDPQPQAAPTEQERGSKEISKYDPEYTFLVKLVKLLVKEGVSPQEIKSIADAYPFVTVDDVGDLTAKLWTLATEKYQIPREWLINHLPKNASLKKTADAFIDKGILYEAIETAAERYAGDISTAEGADEFEEIRQNLMDMLDDVESLDQLQDAQPGVFAEYMELIQSIQPSAIDQINQLPQLNKEDKINTLLEQLSREQDPQKQERIKQSIERVKHARLHVKAGQVVQLFETRVFINPNVNQILNLLKKSEFNDLRYIIDKKDNTYVWDASAAVHEDMGNGLGLSNDTVQDAGYIESPEAAELFTNNRKMIHADLWPAQKETQDMLDHAPGYLAYEYGQDKTSKSKKLNVDMIVQILGEKGTPVVRVDTATCVIELQDGSIISFDDAAKRVMEMDKEGVFSGAEFSTTDFNTNPTLDNGPFSSPEDHGAKPQKSPFPNTNWLPADDENLDQQPASNVAASLSKETTHRSNKSYEEILKRQRDTEGLRAAIRDPETGKIYTGYSHQAAIDSAPQNESYEPGKVGTWGRLSGEWDRSTDNVGFVDSEGNFISRSEAEKRWNVLTIEDIRDLRNIASSLKKQANPSARYWIAPDGKEFDAGTHHGAWIKTNKNILKQYGINTSTIGYSWPDMINKGWVRVSNEPAGTGFQIQVKDINNIPSFLDDFVARNFNPGDIIKLGGDSQYIELTDPFPTLQKAIRKAPKTASIKEADLSGNVVNDILQAIQSDGGVTYNLNQGDMTGTANYAVSIYPDREVILPGVDFDAIEQFITTNEDLLNNPTNSFGAWSHDGKVYLDVVATVSDINQAVELGQKNNQIAIWDIANNQEISTGGSGGSAKAFSKKSLIKQAEQAEQALCQEDQDAIAAASSPAYNIAVNNYAEAVKRGHEKDRSLEYAIQSVSNLEKIDSKKLVELINQYL